MVSIRVIAAISLVVVAGGSLQSGQAPPAAAITGMVLAPDGSPVKQGSVLLMMSPTMQVATDIDRNGAFRIVPDGAGARSFFISVPGLAPYRAIVMVPPSRVVHLPPITLRAATYLRARLSTADGEALPATALRHRSVDADGVTIPDPLGHTRLHAEQDGAFLLGPLPRGKLLMAYDRAPLARTRLPDINVAGTQPLIDRGVIVIQPGGQVRLEILDAGGTPVPRHEVWIEDAVQPSPLFGQTEQTNGDGRVAFDRLAPGRYRVWTRTAERCGSSPSAPQLVISRLVSSTADASPTRIVIGGRAVFRIMSALGPLARPVSVAPDAPAETPWQARILAGAPAMRAGLALSSATWCVGSSDAEGRVAFAPMPPGPAQLRVNLFNSSFIVRVNVPDHGREMVINVPDGLTPVHVTDRDSGQPIGSARVVWTGAGGRVEALATPNGDVLLEAVGATGGTLAVNARDYQEVEGVFEETPGTAQEVALVAMPTRLTVRVITADGKPLSGATVELLSTDVARFAVTDATGNALFLDVPPGALRLTAHAEQMMPATISVPEDARGKMVMTLTPSP